MPCHVYRRSRPAERGPGRLIWLCAVPRVQTLTARGERPGPPHLAVCRVTCTDARGPRREVRTASSGCVPCHVLAISASLSGDGDSSGPQQGTIEVGGRGTCSRLHRRLSICMSVCCLSVCLFVCLSVCLSVCLPAPPSVRSVWLVFTQFCPHASLAVASWYLCYAGHALNLCRRLRVDFCRRPTTASQMTSYVAAGRQLAQS